MWLGGLLNPEAYITATRQCIAQANSWSLEELMLDVTITDGGTDNSKVSVDECSFGVIGKCRFYIVSFETKSLFKTEGIKNKYPFHFVIIFLYPPILHLFLCHFTFIHISFTPHLPPPP